MNSLSFTSALSTERIFAKLVAKTRTEKPSDREIDSS